MQRTLIIAVGLGLLAGLAVVCIQCQTPNIEADLTERVKAALTDGGMGFAQATAEGRDLSLEGIAPGRSGRAEAEQLVASVWGVRTVQNNLVVDEMHGEPYTTTISRSETGAITVEGTWPSETLHDGLSKKLGAAFSGVTIEDKTVWRPTEMTQGWLDVLGSAAPLLSGFKPGRAVLRDNAIVIEGEPVDLYAARAARTWLEEKVPAPFVGKAGFVDPVPYATVLSRQGSGVLLTGHVPDAASRETLVARAVALFGKAEVEDHLEVRAREVDSKWMETVVGALGIMRRFENGNATLFEREMTLSGDPMDPAAGEAAKVWLAQLAAPYKARSTFSNSGSEVTEARFDGAVLTLSGHVSDKATRERLVEQGNRAFRGYEVKDAFTVSDHKPDPDRVLVLMEALKHLKQFRKGSLSLTDYALDLSGEPRDADVASHARVWLSYGLPDPYKGKIGFQAPTPYETTVTFDGQKVVIEGKVPDADWRERLIPLARIHFGAEMTIENKTKVVGRAMELKWNSVLGKGMGFLAGFERGQVIMSDYSVVLRGVVSDPKISTAARDYLNLWPTKPFVGHATFQVTTGTKGRLVTPPQTIDGKACQKALSGVMAQSKIEFRDRSCLLEPGSKATIIAIGETMARCPGVLVEIGGHTDTSGASDHNLKLSQLRAESVRDHLVAMGIPGTRLTARGYGEDRPKTGSQTAGGRMVNRRVEFAVMGE